MNYNHIQPGCVGFPTVILLSVSLSSLAATHLTAVHSDKKTNSATSTTLLHNRTEDIHTRRQTHFSWTTWVNRHQKG